MGLRPGALLVLVAVAVRAEAPSPSQEALGDRCVKPTDTLFWYSCNGGEYEIKSIYSESVDILCLSQNTKLNCSRFPSTIFAKNSTLSVFSLTNCALDEPISCFLSKMNVTNVVQLQLQELLTPLTARHFEGLHGATNLYIFDENFASVQKSNLYEAVASLPHLKEVYIHDGQLTLAPRLLQAPSLQVLELRSDSISDLPPGSFEGVPSLELLRLWDNQIVDINNGTFAGLDQVRHLMLDGNRISELRGGALSPLRKLEMLSIEDNPLRRLHGGFLQGLDHLKEVTISSSEPLELDPWAFTDLRSLRYVVLEKCHLQKLSNTLFRGSKNIQTLTLRNNRLERLHPEVFRDQTEMTKLDLSKNQLTNITGDLFRTLKKLEELDLSYNQLEYFPDELFLPLANLRILSASHNKLRQLRPTAFQWAPQRNEVPSLFSKLISLYEHTLEFLDLSYNLIDDTCERRIMVFPQLRSLNLTHNRMSRLPLENFLITGVVTVATVDLSYNNISTVFLNQVSFMEQKTPVKFILDHNPLNCDCHIYSFAKLVTLYNYAQYFSLWNARCNAPVRFKGTRLTQVPLDEFECQVKCPSVCNCTDVPHKDIVKAVCSGVSTEPSNITNKVSLKFTRKPKSLQNLSFGKVLKIDLSGLHLNEIDFVTLPKTVKVLNLSDNNLNYLPKDVLNRNISFALSNNPLFCDCWNQEHVTELQQNSANIMDYPTLRCKDDMLLSQVDVQRICDTRKFTVIGISLTVLGVVFILTVVVIYRYSFELKVYISKYFPYLLPEEKYDASKKFDVFISYAHQDEDFVRDTLLPKLEGPPINVKTCIHSRDWIAGEMIPYNIAKSVEESRRTVIVLSENFLKSIWGLLEFRAAHVQATKEGKTRVVVILLEDVMNKEDLNKEIKAYLRTNTYIKWGEPWFWEKLAYALPKRGKVVDSREEKRLQSIANELTKTGLEMQQKNETRL
ncbi:hypothetical protein K1T71_014960 [Dendrolimus kikuchii]|nr:hypothetical protein K1T71_014960 [Dendrolimus kikuchii]